MAQRNFRTSGEVMLSKDVFIPTGTERLLQKHNGRVNSVSTQIPSCFFFSCYSLSQDDRLAGCLRSSELCLLLFWIPGDGRATSLSDLAAPDHSRDKPAGVPQLGLHGDERQAGHGSGSHLHGQRLNVSEETSLPSTSYNCPPSPP